MKVFGIGCVLFRYSDERILDDQNFGIATFKRAIVDAIEELEQVTNLDYFNIDEENVGFRSFEPDEDGDIFPIPCGFRLSFDLFLPHKVQVNYGRELSTEKFKVDIIYGYDRPILYVSFDTDNILAEADPSTAVSIIRKFLVDRIGGEIICECIGPSPFHADFSIHPVIGSDFFLADESENRSGYARINVIVPASGEVIDIIINKLNETFSRFYYSITQQNILMDHRRTLIEETNNLLKDSNPSVIKRLRAPFHVATKIDNIHRGVVSERLARIQLGSYLSEASAAGELGKDTPLGRFFDEFFLAAESNVWGEFANVANFFEDRRQRLFGNVSVLIGGIVGGVIGALIGSTATFVLTRAAPTQLPKATNQENMATARNHTILPKDNKDAGGKTLTPPPPAPHPAPSAPTTAPDTAP